MKITRSTTYELPGYQGHRMRVLSVDVPGSVITYQDKLVEVLPRAFRVFVHQEMPGTFDEPLEEYLHAQLAKGAATDVTLAVNLRPA